MTLASIEELYDYLEVYPEKGDLIQSTGGVRKLRWKPGKGNKGKSSGTRILYHYSSGMLVILITVYSKSEKENITQAGRNQLKQLIPQLITKYRKAL